MTRPTTRVLLLLLLQCAAGIALASEESELLTTRGVVELHQGFHAEAQGAAEEAARRFAGALQLFASAVEADPSDVYALYFKGVAAGRMGRWDAAVTDLRSVLDINPELTQARLELGIALVKSGQYEEAVTWLTRAQQVPDLDATASFYLGLAQLHLQEWSDARQSFARAARTDSEFAVVSRYYLALVELQAGNRETATELFSLVAREARPDSAIRAEAEQFLIGLQQGQWPTVRPYQLYAVAGLEYDSNVQLAPTSDQAGFDQQADGRAVLSAGGNYTLWQTRPVQLRAGYDFFQSLHFDLSDFNVQANRVTVQATGGMGIVSGGVLGAYDYYLRETDSYMQEGEAFPWLTVAEEWGRSQVFYRFRRRDFKEAAVRDALDSLGHTVGFDQYVYLGIPDRYLVGGYRYDLLDPADGAQDVFMYHANQGWGGIGWMWPLAISTELDFAYRVKDYRAASGGRVDNEYRVICSAFKPVAVYTSVGLTYFGTFNESNQPVYQYNRHIVSLSVQVRF